MRPATKELFTFKNSYRMEFFNRENLTQRILEKMGVVEPVQTENTEPRKLTFRHTVVNKKELHDIKHDASQHIASL